MYSIFWRIDSFENILNRINPINMYSFYVIFITVFICSTRANRIEKRCTCYILTEIVGFFIYQSQLQVTSSFKSSGLPKYIYMHFLLYFPLFKKKSVLDFPPQVLLYMYFYAKYCYKLNWILLKYHIVIIKDGNFTQIGKLNTRRP